MTSPVLFDSYIHKCIGACPDSVVPLILISGLSYYKYNENIISDETYDYLTKYLVNNWNTIKHPHKYLLKLEDLSNTSSTFNIFHDPKLPLIIDGGLQHILKIKRVLERDDKNGKMYLSLVSGNTTTLELIDKYHQIPLKKVISANVSKQARRICFDNLCI